MECIRAVPSASSRRIVQVTFIDDELMHEYLLNLGRWVICVVGGPGTQLLTLWIRGRGYRVVVDGQPPSVSQRVEPP